MLTIGPISELVFSALMFLELIEISNEFFYPSITAVKITKWVTVVITIWIIWTMKRMKDLTRIIWSALFLLFGAIIIPVYVWAFEDKYENKQNVTSNG